ncbi:MAG: DUF1844 domain-containing protein [Deltaproteobacteria bacterium]|nr:DUF1844 domain-containing protein [Deltaproteobacteria bacterium]
MAEPEDKGYTVKDRRFHQLSEEEEARVLEEEAAKQAAQEAEVGPPPGAEVDEDILLPQITFSSFLFSLGSSAFIHLGALPNPDTGEFNKSLPLAKQTIDLLGMLREKTRGNLTADEEDMFDHLLYDLRMQYIKEAG